MRFLMLNWRDPKNPASGGAERVTRAFLGGLQERGHEVYWFANDFPGGQREEIIQGIKFVRGGGTLRVQEIPIAFRDRARGKSKMSFSVALRFFFRWLRAMLQYVARGLRPRENGAKLARTGKALHPETPGK